MEVGEVVEILSPCCKDKIRYLGKIDRIIEKREGQSFPYKLNCTEDPWEYWWSDKELRTVDVLFE